MITIFSMILSAFTAGFMFRDESYGLMWLNLAALALNIFVYVKVVAK